MLAEEFVIDTRLVVEAFKESRGDELDEIAVAFEILAKENEMIAAAGAGLKIIAIFGGDGPDFSPRSWRLPLAT